MRNIPTSSVIKKIVFVCIFLVIIIVSCIFAFVIHAKIAYKDFYDTATSQFKIPEIDSGFTPQGIDFLEEENLFLISGYDIGGISKIYVIDTDKTYREISIFDSNDENFINHAGGICSTDKYIYIAGCDGICYVISRDELINNRSNSVKLLGNFKTYNNADFCYIKNNRIYIGEYYYPIKYKTNDNHHFTTPIGDKNHAIITVFELSDNEIFGVDNIPIEVYSITDIVQGMSITDNGKLILSTSTLYGSSILYIYDYNETLNSQSDSFSVDSKSIPLYYLDSNSLSETIKIPPKSEGIFYNADKLYILFESASNKFVLGKFIGGEYVYSIKLNE